MASISSQLVQAHARVEAAYAAKDALIDKCTASKKFDFPDFTDVDAEIKAANAAEKALQDAALTQAGAGAASTAIDFALALSSGAFGPTFSASLLDANILQNVIEATAFGNIALAGLKTQFDQFNSGAPIDYTPPYSPPKPPPSEAPKPSPTPQADQKSPSLFIPPSLKSTSNSGSGVQSSYAPPKSYSPPKDESASESPPEEKRAPESYQSSSPSISSAPTDTAPSQSHGEAVKNITELLNKIGSELSGSLSLVPVDPKNRQIYQKIESFFLKLDDLSQQHKKLIVEDTVCLLYVVNTAIQAINNSNNHHLYRAIKGKPLERHAKAIYERFKFDYEHYYGLC